MPQPLLRGFKKNYSNDYFDGKATVAAYSTRSQVVLGFCLALGAWLSDLNPAACCGVDDHGVHGMGYF